MPTDMRLAALAVLAFVPAACGAPDPAATNGTAEPANAEAPIVDQGAALPPDAEEPAANDVAPPANAAAPESGATEGGDGSEITLSPLTEADLSAASLPGELACSFGERGARQPLLLGKGDVGSRDNAAGIWKIGTSVETVQFVDGGGYDGMAKGGRVAGKGLTGRIAITSRQGIGAGESPGYPATLTLDRMDGGRKVITGVYTCGP